MYVYRTVIKLVDFVKFNTTNHSHFTQGHSGSYFRSPPNKNTHKIFLLAACPYAIASYVYISQKFSGIRLHVAMHAAILMHIVAQACKENYNINLQLCIATHLPLMTPVQSISLVAHFTQTENRLNVCLNLYQCT